MFDKKLSGIYIITINDKIYIGSAICLNRRWKEHQNNLKKNKHENQFLQNAWNKYKEATFEIICNCPKFCLLGMEQYYIDKHWDKKINCFNISKNSKAPMEGRKHSQETKDRMSETRKNISDETRKYLSDINKGKIMSDETKKKISISNIGKKHSEESKLLMSKSLMGHKVSEETRINMSNSGKLRPPMSEITRNKIAETSRGRKHTEETKKQMAINATGKKHTEESKQKMSEAKLGHIPWNKGISFSEEVKNNMKLSAKKNLKTYTFIDPNGGILHIKGLKQYCIDNNLVLQYMIKFLNNTLQNYKGYKRIGTTYIKEVPIL